MQKFAFRYFFPSQLKTDLSYSSLYTLMCFSPLGASVVLHQHLKGRGRGGAVFRQHVLTRPLKVKCPSVKSVVVGVSEHRADTGLCG